MLFWGFLMLHLQMTLSCKKSLRSKAAETIGGPWSTPKSGFAVVILLDEREEYAQLRSPTSKGLHTFVAINAQTFCDARCLKSLFLFSNNRFIFCMEFISFPEI